VSAILTFSGFLACYLGFAALALTQRRPRQVVDLSSRWIPKRTVVGLRTSGVLLIATGFAVAIATEGWGFGSIAFGAMVCISALLVTLTFTWGSKALGALLAALRIP
tara:strand:+ start:203 stop:523 length:321 start_codon:yes stop_codon:yes gene_type:complete